MDARETAPAASHETPQPAARQPAAPSMGPAAVLALQQAAGNRAVAALARMPEQRLARAHANQAGELVEGGNLLGGQFAAFIPGVGTQVIQVRPWNAPDGTNNNYLDIEGFEKKAVRQASSATYTPSVVQGIDVPGV